MDHHYTYATCCVESDAESIHAMRESPKEITYATMRRHCPDLLKWANNVGYAFNSRNGLTLKNDWHVGYYRSEYRGQRCYYLVWSAIECIWLEMVV